MPERLHVITAVTRPANLAAIAHSLGQAMQDVDLELVWHWLYDLDQENVGGQAVKNQVLDGIADGWVWVLDDDTIANENVLAAFAQAISRYPDAQAVVFSQHRQDGPVLRAHPANARPGQIDIGQAFLRRSLIGDARIPIDYNGDGMILEQLLADATVAYIDDVLTVHNALR